LAVCAFTSSCGWRAGSYAPPEQLSLVQAEDPAALGPFIEMGDPRSDDFVVRDVTPEHAALRWTFIHPELRFRLKETAGLNFEMRFVLADVTFKVTGPVTVSCAIEGQPLGSLRCDRAGEYRFAKPVPAQWLSTDKEVHVTFSAEPRWVSPEDGNQLGFLLRSAGFVRTAAGDAR
jgi:hypothetical protein